jgi:misacylated tRNA(Ala) deacylase
MGTMTDLLFLRDAYLREFDATVVAVDPTASGWRSTAPPSTTPAAASPTTPACSAARGDRRRSGRKEGDVVWHTVGGGPDDLPVVGDTVHGEIDWERRHELMRTHTALHVLCGVIWNEWGTPVTGANMEPLAARMDFEFDPLPEGFKAPSRSWSTPSSPPTADRGVVPPRSDRGGRRRPHPHQGEPHPRVGHRDPRRRHRGARQAGRRRHPRGQHRRGRAVRVVKTESKGKGNKRLRIEVVDADG